MFWGSYCLGKSVEYVLQFASDIECQRYFIVFADSCSNEFIFVNSVFASWKYICSLNQRSAIYIYSFTQTSISVPVFYFVGQTSFIYYDKILIIDVPFYISRCWHFAWIKNSVGASSTLKLGIIHLWCPFWMLLVPYVSPFWSCPLSPFICSWNLH